MVNQGTIGLVYLADLANRDIFGLSYQILDHLSRTESLILEIIVPLLMETLMDPSLSRHRDLSLAALNRLAPLLGSSDIVLTLTSLLQDANIDKKLLLATIRSAGMFGE